LHNGIDDEIDLTKQRLHLILKIVLVIELIVGLIMYQLGTISFEKWNNLILDLAAASSYYECSFGIISSRSPWITSSGVITLAMTSMFGNRSLTILASTEPND
jgi:hypothetical protein